MKKLITLLILTIASVGLFSSCLDDSESDPDFKVHTVEVKQNTKVYLYKSSKSDNAHISIEVSSGGRILFDNCIVAGYGLVTSADETGIKMIDRKLYTRSWDWMNNYSMNPNRGYLLEADYYPPFGNKKVIYYIIYFKDFKYDVQGYHSPATLMYQRVKSLESDSFMDNEDELVWEFKEQMIGTWRDEKKITEVTGYPPSLYKKTVTFNEDSTFRINVQHTSSAYLTRPGKDEESTFIGEYSRILDEYKERANVLLKGKQYDLADKYIGELELKCDIKYDEATGQLVISCTSSSDKNSLISSYLSGSYTKGADYNPDEDADKKKPDQGPDFLVHSEELIYNGPTYIYRATTGKNIYLNASGGGYTLFENCKIQSYGPLIEANEDQITFKPEETGRSITQLSNMSMDPNRAYQLVAPYRVLSGPDRGKEIDIYYNIYFSEFEYTQGVGYYRPKRLHYQRVN